MNDAYERLEANRERFLNNFKPKGMAERTNQESTILLARYIKQSANGQFDERLQEWILKCMSVLTPRQKRVVELRFGLKPGSRSMTHREVAGRMGLTVRSVKKHWSEASRRMRGIHTSLENRSTRRVDGTRRV